MPASKEPCDCGCGRLALAGVRPRFVDESCRERWRADLSIADQPAPEAQREPARLDRGPQVSPPPSVPVRVEEVAETQTEFASRVSVAPEVEAALRSGMAVQPRPRSLLRTLVRAARKVW